ncbi:MAG: DEAD/DEAH box helicase [Micrococcaceae bacterium]
MSETFADYNVDQRIIASLEADGITQPFPIQALTLPIALDGKDIIGQAQTGTGKTLGFCIPLLQKIYTSPTSSKPRALVVVPTRELAVQVAEDIEQASSASPIRLACIYGGRSYSPQVERIKKGVDIVVGTPGRLLDLVQQKLLDLSEVDAIVLDEADRMLDLGFSKDIDEIFSLVKKDRQTMLFSATMPVEVLGIARTYMNQAMHIRAEHDKTSSGATNKNIKQLVYRCHAMDKDEVLGRLLQAEGRGRTIIFSNTKRAASRLVDELKSRGFNARPLHGDMNQEAREKSLKAFKNGKCDILVATDVAARGIDVDDVTHVINMQCPENEEAYVHRIGRTGRAGNDGTSVTFVDWEFIHQWSLINKALKLDIPEPIETYSTSDHLFSDLSIPAGTKGRLKTAPQEKKPRHSNTKHSQKRNRHRHDNKQQTQKNQQQTERKPRRNRQRKRRVIKHES